MFNRESLMVSISGVRGILGEGMNPAAAERYTAAYAEWLKGSHVVVGRDSRASGRSLSHAVVSALNFKGIEVTDIGIASTPTVEIMVEELGADGGIIITASHNNERWNALKFLDSSGEFIDASAVEAIEAMVAGSGILYDPPGRPGLCRKVEDADQTHIERILGLDVLDAGTISSRGLSAAIDCVNGAGSRIVPMLLERLGVAVKAIHTDVESPFPHDPEPRPANLAELSGLVRETGADIGIAVDPDADRLVLVGEDGVVCSEELTLALAADFVLGKRKGPVAANLSSSRLIDDIARRHGVSSFRSKVGEANVIAVMKRHGAVIGGEGNGGVIFPAIHYGRDAMTGMALILQMLAEEDVGLCGKIASLPSYRIIKEKMPFDGDLDAVGERLEKEFEGEINTIDGIRIDMPSGWVHLRRSNTEPVVRIIAEAGNDEEAAGLVSRVREILGRQVP
ncbi:MAG TPA: phosphoglucosamine mutase [Candidatus Krumholzibacterium sp.]|nr:phosphoglucosamine mutase [Candidatus Krumholzibacterium sp.]